MFEEEPDNAKSIIEEKYSIRPFINLLIGNWYLFVFYIVASLTIGSLINYYSINQYSISATLLLKEGGSRSATDVIKEDLGLPDAKRPLTTELNVLRSRSLYHDVINDLGYDITYIAIGRVQESELYKDNPFIVSGQLLDSGYYGRWFFINLIDDQTFELKYQEEFKVYRFGESIKTKNFDIKIFKNDAVAGFNFKSGQKLDFKFKFNNSESLVNYYKKVVNVNLIKETSIFELQINDPIPQRGKDILNKVCETYIRYGIDEKNLIANNTIYFINEQIKDISAELTIGQDSFQRFREVKGSIDLSDESKSLSTQMENIEAEKFQLETELKILNFIYEYISANKDLTNLSPSTMGIADVTLSAQIQKLRDLQISRQRLLYESKVTNPQLITLEQEIESVHSSLLNGMFNLRKNYQIRLSSLEEQRGKFKYLLSRIPETERKFLDLNRKLNLSEKIYTYLLQKRAEIGIAKAGTISDNKVLDSAYLKGLVSPNRQNNLLIALFIGLTIPALIIFLRQFLDDKIRSKVQIEKSTTVPLIGVISHSMKPTKLVVRDNPKSQISEAFRSVRTNLQYFHHEEGSKVIVVTSTIGGEGKTFCAMNLSSVISLSDKKVVLIGMDMRKPKIFDDFNLTNTVGISTYLIAKATEEEIIQKTDLPNLDIITSGPVPPNPSELLMSERLLGLIKNLRLKYDYIIIDTAPVGLVTDGLLLMQHADLNIYVLRENYSRLYFLNTVNEIHENADIKNQCLLLNDSNLNNSKYGYGYGNGYSYGYRYNYGYGNNYGYYEDHKTVGFFDKIKGLFTRKK